MHTYTYVLCNLLSKALCVQRDAVTNLDKARKQLSVSWQDERFRYSSPGQSARCFREWSYTHKGQEKTTAFSTGVGEACNCTHKKYVCTHKIEHSLVSPLQHCILTH